VVNQVQNSGSVEITPTTAATRKPLLTTLLVENAHGLPHDRSENMLSRLPWDSLRLSTSSEEKLKTRF